MTEVIMPKMGDGMEEGTLLEWLKADGDQVKSGEVIGTIQTDKATLELEAPGTGTLTGFLVGAGETVPVGRPIAMILKKGEALPEGYGTAATSAAVAAPLTASPTAVASAPAPAAPANGGRVVASPLARRIAAERGVDLLAVSGSGPGGRIVERDVIAAAANGGPKAPAVVAPVRSAEDRDVALNRLRQITAQRTAQSKQTIPHFYVTVEVDVERIQDLREQLEEAGAGKPSVNDFVIKACAMALRDQPHVNALFVDAKTVRELGGVHIGMAVATDDGLTVPVLHGADRLTLREIGERSRELAAKARENKLHPDELSGSTFSISNMGMLDVDNFLAIVNQPNSGILAVSSARKKVVASEHDEIKVRLRMNITASFDHRIVDGAIGAKFVNAVRAYLENPIRLVM